MNTLCEGACPPGGKAAPIRSLRILNIRTWPQPKVYVLKHDQDRGMRNGFLHKLALLGSMLLLCLGQVQAATEKSDSQAVNIAILEKALAYYHENGDSVCGVQPTGRICRQGPTGRLCLVLDTKGVMLASGGPSSALIGRDVSETLGPDLQKTFKDALKVPEGNGIQQAEYRWQNWADGKIERKHVYYQRVGQQILAVGITCHGRQRNRPWHC